MKSEAKYLLRAIAHIIKKMSFTALLFGIIKTMKEE